MAEGSMLSGLAKRFGFGHGGGETGGKPVDEAAIRAWLVSRLAKQLKLDPAEINPSTQFDAYGLDSRVAVQVAGELEKLMDRRLSPALLFEHPSIDSLASFLGSALHDSGENSVEEALDANGVRFQLEEGN